MASKFRREQYAPPGACAPPADGEGEAAAFAAFYARAFDLSPDGVLLVDPDTLRPILFNETAHRTLGYDRDEFARMTMLDHYPAEAADAIRAWVGEALAGGLVEFDARARTRTGDSRRLHVWVRAAVVDGRAALHATHRDVTDERRVDEELHRSRDLLERTGESLRLQGAALQAAADGVLITDREGVIEWANPAFTALTGYSMEDALGRNPRELIKSGKHSAEFYKQIWRTILAGGTWSGEIVNRRKDGMLYHEEMSVTPIRDGGGEITHFVAIKRDISERLKLEAQFRQAQKMELVGRLASGIAHDFNNLLAVIIGIGEMAGTVAHIPDRVRADLRQIVDAGERAASLTRQLLAFSRKQVLSPMILDLNDVIANAEQLLRRLLRDDIELAVCPAEALWNVHADPHQVEQIVVNLAVNARDAMPDGGRLTIETCNVTIDADYGNRVGVEVPPGRYVRLSVDDTGIGMDEATRSRIFEPFFTTKPPGEGTGLGLSTVYGIVKQSRGFVWAYSEPGQGASFHVYLPVVDGTATPPPPEPSRSAQQGTETILLVEDNPTLHALTTRILEAAGYTVIGALSGGDALDRLAACEGTVHLLLTDVVMPQMSGAQVAERAVHIEPLLKVLYMSGYTDEVLIGRNDGHSEASFINKPFTTDALLGKVRDVLDG